MVVSPDYSGRLIYEFKEKSAEIIDKYGLTHLRGTEKLDPVTKVAAEFISLAEQSSTNPTMTESMLESEKRMYLRTIEQKVLEASKGQANSLRGLHAQAFGQPFVKDVNWDKTVTSVAKEVDRISTNNSDLFNSLTPEEQQQMDEMFALVVDTVRNKQSRDPSAMSAQKAEADAARDLKQVEKQLKKIAKGSVKKRQTDLFNDTNDQLQRYLKSFAQLRKAMKPEEVKKAQGHIASIKSMMKEFRTNRRLVTDRELLEAHIAGIQDQFRMLNDMEGSVSETVSAVAGIFGSSGRRTNKSYFSVQGLGNMVSYDSIKDKHPERTNPAHIRSMQYFMNQGLSFEQAHEAASAYGFTPKGESGVRYFDLDQRVNYLGQVPATEERSETYTLQEHSSGRKMINTGAVTLGGVGTLGLAALVGVAVLVIGATSGDDE